MRTRSLSLVPSVLVLTLISLLVAPIAALAQSGAPAISMYPETAGPGSTVEITGIDFPAERVVEVQLATPDGTTSLTTATTSPDGDFRQIVALPIGITEGAWELQATAADGTTSSFAFMTSPDAAVDAAPAAPVVEAPTTTTTTGNSGGDIALMIIIAVALGGIVFGAMVVYRQFRADSPPGMGKGDDLIWGGGSPDSPAQTATDEPHWKDGQGEQATQPAQSES